MKRTLLTGLYVFILINSNAQPGFKIINTFKIASAGGWDYIAVQPNSNRVFASHGGQVNILDKNTGDSLGFIPNTTGVHGIAFIPALNKGFTSNGRLNNVTVFDLNTFAVKDSIATGQNPDAIFYDDFSKRIITCNGRSNDVSFIDPASNKVTATVAVGGKPETAVSNGAGKIFVNIEDKNEIVVINTNTFSAEAHWSLLPGEEPTGLAIDLTTKRLFAACSDTKLLEVLDADKGNIVAKIPIGEGCDGAGFDKTLKNIYTSNAEGTMTVIHEDSNDKFNVTETVKTKRGARTMTVDQETHKIYLPTAEFEPATPQGQRPKMIPGTFQVLVLGKG